MFMIPEAVEAADSLIVLPRVAGFLFAFYLALNETFAIGWSYLPNGCDESFDGVCLRFARRS